jgi:hypothetical protein
LDGSSSRFGIARPSDTSSAGLSEWDPQGFKYFYDTIHKPQLVMPASTNEADIIVNRANVALAQSQRLIASWLPPRTDEERANAKSEEDIEEEEREIFTPVPEL